MSPRERQDFESFMKSQIQEIRQFKNSLEEALGREIETETAARAWIKEYAPRFRNEFEQRQRNKRAVG
jgi:hypothetical protein